MNIEQSIINLIQYPALDKVNKQNIIKKRGAIAKKKKNVIWHQKVIRKLKKNCGKIKNLKQKSKYENYLNGKQNSIISIDVADMKRGWIDKSD